MVTGACTQATASDANGYVGSDTSFCNKVDVTIANTTTARRTSVCTRPRRRVPGAVEHLQPGNPRGPDVQRRSDLCARRRCYATYVVTDQLDSAVPRTPIKAWQPPFRSPGASASSPVGRRRTRFRGPGAAGPHRIWKAEFAWFVSQLEGQYTERSAFSGDGVLSLVFVSAAGASVFAATTTPIRAPSRLPLCN